MDDEIQAYSYINNYAITFDAAPSANSIVNIERITPYDEAYITWSDGTILIADELNAQTLQHLFITQENYNNLKDLSDEVKRLLASLGETQALLLKYSKAMPIPFGRFYVDSDGNLKITLYGVVPDDTLRITNDGTLQLEVTMTEV